MPHLRRASWTMALLHVAMVAWVLCSGLAGRWALEESPFRRQGGGGARVSVFLINLRPSHIRFACFSLLVFLRTVDELT